MRQRSLDKKTRSLRPGNRSIYPGWILTPTLVWLEASYELQEELSAVQEKENCRSCRALALHQHVVGGPEKSLQISIQSDCPVSCRFHTSFGRGNEAAGNRQRNAVSPPEGGRQCDP